MIFFITRIGYIQTLYDRPLSGAATANQFVWGPAYFGPGVMNPTARRPLPQLIARADEVVASNPNVRVVSVVKTADIS